MNFLQLTQQHILQFREMGMNNKLQKVLVFCIPIQLVRIYYITNHEIFSHIYGNFQVKSYENTQNIWNLSIHVVLTNTTWFLNYVVLVNTTCFANHICFSQFFTEKHHDVFPKHDVLTNTTCFAKHVVLVNITCLMKNHVLQWVIQ